MTRTSGFPPSGPAAGLGLPTSGASEIASPLCLPLEFRGLQRSALARVDFAGMPKAKLAWEKHELKCEAKQESGKQVQVEERLSALQTTHALTTHDPERKQLTKTNNHI